MKCKFWRFLETLYYLVLIAKQLTSISSDIDKTKPNALRRNWVPTAQANAKRLPKVIYLPTSTYPTPSHCRGSLLSNSLQVHGSDRSPVGATSISPRAGTTDSSLDHCPRRRRGRHRGQGRRRGRHQRVLVVHPVVLGNLGLQGNAEVAQVLLSKEDPVSFTAVDVVPFVMKLCDAFGGSVRQTRLGGPLNVGSRTSSTPSGRGGGVVAGPGRHIGYFSGATAAAA